MLADWIVNHQPYLGSSWSRVDHRRRTNRYSYYLREGTGDRLNVTLQQIGRVRCETKYHPALVALP